MFWIKTRDFLARIAQAESSNRTIFAGKNYVRLDQKSMQFAAGFSSRGPQIQFQDNARKCVADKEGPVRNFFHLRAIFHLIIILTMPHQLSKRLQWNETNQPTRSQNLRPRNDSALCWIQNKVRLI
jgi:hypothetical protein